ncbi:hypothetical protein Q5P01_018337 [Channa striata]|uniref:RDD domain-containing protein n=1 Tax=Channa striata TaxID=64152 RepID=A0AA88S8X4_CHASR|nr:hypothetical protein Q5P01_018337 [Channa striata]
MKLFSDVSSTDKPALVRSLAAQRRVSGRLVTRSLDGGSVMSPTTAMDPTPETEAQKRPPTADNGILRAVAAVDVALPVGFPRVLRSSGGCPSEQSPAGDARPAQPHNGHPAPAGREYTIPSPLQRFLAETLDFFILFCVKATIVLWIMYLSGMTDIAKFITHFIVEEIDENTSMEDLQKMMAVALVYRVLVCVYEIICIWGTGGATPGKFLLGLQVVKCDSTALIRPNRVLVVPASNVSLSASTVRALNKNFSIAFLFPVFITVLFFQHNRTVYDIVAGTIVVQRRGAR